MLKYFRTRDASELTNILGWRRSAFAFGFGVCATAAMPPLYIFPLLVPAFAGLLWLLSSAPSPRRAFFDGWWWGMGHYTTGLYWMCIALLTDPAQFGWLIPFTLVGLNGIIALYPALAGLAWHYIRPEKKWGPLCFAALWSAVEFARGHVFTGFPWNLGGYAWAFSDAMSQSVSVIGIYGLTFITVLAACSIIGGRKQALACALLLIAMAGVGAWRLQAAGETQFVSGVSLRIVQGDIAQSLKWDPKREQQILAHYAQLSRAPGAEKITLIWPETAVPFPLMEDGAVAGVLSRLAPMHGALLTGVLRLHGENRDFQAWNSLAVITPGGLAATYDKHHLVPFGEFVPFRAWVPVAVMPAGMASFSRGPGPQTLDIPGAPPASPLICYEAIFPQEATDSSGRAGWLLNVTNDAWFGNSSGPYQHFAMARFRAIEQGLPLVRAANTGISAVTDAYGRVIARLPLGVEGVLDSGLPRRAASTIYGSIGDKYFLLLISILLAFTLFRRIFTLP